MLIDYYSATTFINVKLLSYLIIYNVSLMSIFIVLFTTTLSTHKTLVSFSKNYFNSTNIFNLTISLMSLAGVPPFIGFFTKLFILILISLNSFFIMYFFFIIVLLTGLYFYIQNIRYIHSSKSDDIIVYSNNTLFRPLSITYYNLFIIFMTIIIFGFLLMDDILLVITWFFS